MNHCKLGRQTYQLAAPPSIAGFANVVGKKEGDGPLAATFDRICPDGRLGEATWEKAECAMQRGALQMAADKAGVALVELDYLLGGDLLNQCISSGYAAREHAVPFFGLYGACSTMAESLGLAAMLLSGGHGAAAGALVSSHFCTAERQYRTPLEYGGQRTPTAQWTATAAGAVILKREGPGPYVTHVTVGTVTDWGIKDANNMGAAMAPAAYQTISAHLRDTGRAPGFYDLVITGDLGALGKALVLELFARDHLDLAANYDDCGVLLYDSARQDTHCGASGCGCSAAVLTGYLLRGMCAGRWKNILFCGTGALHSPVSLGQGESIPGICHAVAISSEKGA